jgi:hypothetical protein
MNTMQSFYASLSSSDKPLDTYLKILADLTKIKREQAKALVSDMGWQEWGEQPQKTVAA